MELNKELSILVHTGSLMNWPIVKNEDNFNIWSTFPQFAGIIFEKTDEMRPSQSRKIFKVQDSSGRYANRHAKVCSHAIWWRSNTDMSYLRPPNTKICPANMQPKSSHTFGQPSHEISSFFLAHAISYVPACFNHYSGAKVLRLSPFRGNWIIRHFYWLGGVWLRFLSIVKSFMSVTMSVFVEFSQGEKNSHLVSDRDLISWADGNPSIRKISDSLIR